ncbi:MAG: racemase [Candidatus Tectimicrobiota bacterium]|nr:MAG: racemase [Candidatus Tectomicrobia bacterium]
MRITDVEVHVYAWPRPKPIRNGKYTYTTVVFNLVHVRTDEGLTGIGWGGATASTRPGEVFRSLVEHFKVALIGADPFTYRRLWANMWLPKIVGRRGLTTQVLSAIDIALWDLMGKAVGQPVAKLLGGYTDRIPAYIAGGYYEEGKGLKELAREMEENLALGAKAVKMKIGGASIAEDVERVRVVRETVGPQVKLLVDANNAYSVHEAIAIARKLEPYDVFWFEEPVAPDDYRGHARVARATTIPVATGENEYTRYGFRDLIAHEAAAILNPDAQILGGITEFMQVAALAAAHDLPIAPHGAQEIHVHLVTAIPNGLLLEVYRETVDPLRSQIFTEPLRLDKNGYVRVPDRPGLGVEPNYELLQRYRVA